MSSKIILSVFVQVFLMQSISGQLLGALNGLLDGYGVPWTGSLGVPCASSPIAGPLGFSGPLASLSQIAAPIASVAPLAAPIASLAPIATPIASLAQLAAPIAPQSCGAPIPLEWAGLIPGGSYSGSFAVSSYSPITPTGISVASENAYDGVLNVAGQLPFLSTVALEGILPSAGAGVISYGCGNGNLAIINEDLGLPEPSYGPAGYGGLAGYAGLLGYNSPLGYGGPGRLGLAGIPGLGFGLH